MGCSYSQIIPLDDIDRGPLSPRKKMLNDVKQMILDEYHSNKYSIPLYLYNIKPEYKYTKSQMKEIMEFCEENIKEPFLVDMEQKTITIVYNSKYI